MTTSPLRRRLGATLACATLVAGLSACGGDDDGGGGSKGDYQSALNTFCKSVETGSNTFKTEATSVQTSAGSNPTAAIKKLGTLLDDFASTIDGALTKLKAVDVPGDYEKFSDQAIKGVDQLVSTVRDAAKAATSGNAEAVTKLGSALDSLKLPDLPKDLADKAPACGSIPK